VQPTEEKAPELSEIVKPRFIVGHGLSNLGNTCFMNCVVQVLAHLTDFRKSLDGSEGNGRPVTAALGTLIDELLNRNENQTIVDPTRFKQVLAACNKTVSASHH